MEHNTAIEKELAEGNISILIAKFAIPSVTAMLVNALYNIVDQIFIARGVGYLGNGAANVVLLLTLCALAVSLWIGDGTAAYMSLCLGAGEKGRAADGVKNGILLITGSSVVLLGFCFTFMEPVFRFFGCTAVLLPLAKEYGFWIILGLPSIMVSTAINSMIRADGSPRFAMASMVIGAVVNACLDVVFIFGFSWGIKGAGMATFIGQTVSFLISAIYLKKFQCITLRWAGVPFQRRILGKILGLGCSSFIDQIAFALVMTVNNNLIVHYGAASVYGSEIPLTAYGMSMKIQEILFTILLGIAIGMQPIVGFNFGAGNIHRTKKAYWTAVLIGTVISVLATAGFIFIPEKIVWIFGIAQKDSFFTFSIEFMRTYFFFYCFFGFQTITGIFFQAIGQGKKAAFLSLLYHIGFKIFFALVFANIWGLHGVILSGPAADIGISIVTGSLIFYQMRQFKQNR